MQEENSQSFFKTLLKKWQNKSRYYEMEKTEDDLEEFINKLIIVFFFFLVVVPLPNNGSGLTPF